MEVGFQPIAEQQAAPVAFMFNFCRRYACDRCRGQKLRCNRDLMASPDNPCLRCRKAKTECIIASSTTRRGGSSGQARARGRARSVSTNLQNTAVIRETNIELSETTVEPSRHNLKKNNISELTSQPLWNAAPNVQSPRDISQLECISWQDVFGSPFNATQETDFSRIAATLPTPVTPTDATLSNRPGNQQTFTPSEHFSNSNISEIAQNDSQYNLLANSADFLQTDKNSAMASLQTRDSGFTSPHRDETEAGSNLVSRADEPSPALSDNHDELSASRPEHNAFEGCDTTSADFNDKKIEILSELSTSLMKDLHRIIACESAGAFLLNHADSTAAEYFFKSIDSTISSDYTIGKMLQASEKFLEVVKFLNQSAPSDSYADSEMPGNYTSAGFEEANYYFDASLEARMEERWRFIQTVLSRANQLAGHESAGTCPVQNFGHRQHPKRDVPFTFALLTCYTCLIKIYESVFSLIHHSMNVCRKWTLPIKFPQTIAGLQIDGFLLQNHCDLQVKILVQVSTYMLDSIEKALGAKLFDPLFQALLKASLQQEGYGSVCQNETGTRIVRDLMKNIENNFRNGNS